MATAWKGVFAIPPTPFDESGVLDEESLRACIRFCIACRVHGIVAPVNASEFMYLNDNERRCVVEIVLGEVQGQVPVVVGVTASHSALAASLARHAQEHGADAVIAMPPHVQPAAPNEIESYFSVLNSAIDIPIFLQNYGGPGGTPMSGMLMAKMLRELDNVEFVKEETERSSHLISEIQELASEHLRGVMGGKAGRHLLEEHRRGVCGTMPACEIAEVHVSLWEALESGDIGEAHAVYRTILPLLLFETTYGVSVYKEILRRRGVIRSAFHRQVGGKVLDKHARAELDQILEEIEPLMTIREGWSA